MSRIGDYIIEQEQAGYVCEYAEPVYGYTTYDQYVEDNLNEYLNALETYYYEDVMENSHVSI